MKRPDTPLEHGTTYLIENGGIIERTMLIVVKRSVLTKLHNMRWEGLHSVDAWQRHHYGIKKDGLEEVWFSEMAKEMNQSFLTRVIFYTAGFFNKNYRKYHIGHFMPKVEYVIEICIEEGYLKLDHGYLRLSDNGLKMISWSYYPKMFFENDYIKTFISAVIQWGVPLLAIWVVSHFFTITATSK